MGRFYFSAPGDKGSLVAEICWIKRNGYMEELSMMQLAVGIEMIFTELDFVSRIDAVASNGLVAFELWDWKDKNIPAIDESKKKTLFWLYNKSRC